jgi:hypothetical protein
MAFKICYKLIKFIAVSFIESINIFWYILHGNEWRTIKLTPVVACCWVTCILPLNISAISDAGMVQIKYTPLITGSRMGCLLHSELDMTVLGGNITPA